MTTKHTPGPWHVFGAQSVLVALDKDRIVNCRGFHSPSPVTIAESQANARLIAAAPAMLAALELAKAVMAERLAEWPESEWADTIYLEPWKAACAAIAKAKGTTA